MNAPSLIRLFSASVFGSRKILGLALALLALPLTAATKAPPQTPVSGVASWYGEAHRGKLMANGMPFDPDKLTAASWFYPLGTKVRVTSFGGSGDRRSVVVTITDRGPGWKLVHAGRIIDLGYAAFRRIADPDSGLTKVTVEVAR